MSFTRASKGISASPLSALPAVVIDTETTGLNVQKDQIIEIAGVKIEENSVTKGSEFESFVLPDQPISAASSKIHGITDKDVAKAPPFSEVLPSFRDWIDERLWVGFSIDFDTAIFEAEHNRIDLGFTPPRVLDVRDLVEWLRPNLPDYALETVAGWLDVRVNNRHRALADAKMTAEVFIRLIPRLEAKGIKTLAQAERVTNRQVAAPQLNQISKIDSFAYRHRVSEVMTSPAWVEPGSKTLKTIVQNMVKRGYSSVFVEEKRGYGVATQNDILALISKHPKEWTSHKLNEVAHFPLPLVEKSEMLYRAIDLLAPSTVRHIGVINAAGELVGAVSAKDLIGQRGIDDVSLDREIRNAASRAALGRVWPKLVEVSRALIGENVEPRTVANFISRELQALTHRACELAEAEMVAEDKGSPPVQYSMIVLGSGGRGESMLAMDQDNAIIFEDGGDFEKNDQYFQELGQKVADILDAVGVTYCKGGIMGSNAEWRRTVPAWSSEVSDWISRSQPDDILHCDIFFDALGVHGANEMVRKLRREAIKQAQSARIFLQAVSMNVAKFRSPLGMFNRIRTEEGRVDLKIGGIMPIFSAARVLGVMAGSAVRATPLRLAAAKEQGIITESQFENLDAAHKIFIERILHQQLEDLRNGIKLSNSVEIAKLTDIERNDLIWAFKQSSEIPTVLDVPTQ